MKMRNFGIFHPPSQVSNPHEINKILRVLVTESYLLSDMSLYDRALLSPTPHDWCVVAVSKASDGHRVKKWTVF